MEPTRRWVNPDRLLRLLESQRNCYRRLRELSLLQRSLISGDRPELLLNVLGDRQRIVNELAGLNEQLAPFRQDWEGVYESLPAEVRVRAGELLDEINGLLRVILQNDQEDSALLAARKESVRGALAQLDGGRHAQSAYRPTPRRPSGGSGADFRA